MIIALTLCGSAQMGSSLSLEVSQAYSAPASACEASAAENGSPLQPARNMIPIRSNKNFAVLLINSPVAGERPLGPVNDLWGSLSTGVDKLPQRSICPRGLFAPEVYLSANYPRGRSARVTSSQHDRAAPHSGSGSGCCRLSESRSAPSAAATSCPPHGA